MKHVIINPTLTPEEIQKVKALREHNPSLRLWLFEKSHFRTIGTVEREKQILNYKRSGFFVREISIDFDLPGNMYSNIYQKS